MNKFDFVTQGRQTVRSPCGSTLQDLRYLLSVFLSSCLQLQPWQPQVGAGAPPIGITAMMTPFVRTLGYCLKDLYVKLVADYSLARRLRKVSVICLCRCMTF